MGRHTRAPRAGPSRIHAASSPRRGGGTAGALRRSGALLYTFTNAPMGTAKAATMSGRVRSPVRRVRAAAVAKSMNAKPGNTYDSQSLGVSISLSHSCVSSRNPWSINPENTATTSHKMVKRTVRACDGSPLSWAAQVI